VTTSFIFSSGSEHSEAFVKYSETCAQISQILEIVERGSKILTGKDICEIESPFSRFMASYLARFAIIPDCF